MINSYRHGAPFSAWRLLFVLALLACFSTAALAANHIAGSVRNVTRAEPAAGDQVILLRMENEMREESRLKVDAGGMFSFNVQYPDKPYLVRVTHEGVSYDQQASAGDVLAISVFDAAPRVPDITGGIEILRAGTNGNLLHVSDMVEILNDSKPPRTQAGSRAFEVYLPPNARVDSVLAAGPGKMAVMISAVPVPGDPGHYTLAFPLRPGASKFAFNYDLPYENRAAFHTRHAYPLQQLAVMIPPTMKFSSRSAAFRMLATGNSRYQVQAVNHLGAGNGPDFELAGTGTLPQLEGQASSQVHWQSAPPLNPGLSAPPALLPSSAGMDLNAKPAKLPSQTLVLSVVTVVLLAICALLLRRARKTPPVSRITDRRRFTTFLQS
jgi:hypothetical protein